MEMNTRLQVEHPVTEMITGVDLVAWQLRVAAGEPLPAGQDELAARGHAIEARLYAEDPARDFLPTAGRLRRFRLPAAGEGLRIDSGVGEGDAVPLHYDPLLAKVVAQGPDRGAALMRLAAALEAVEVEGIATNRAFLAALAHDKRFVKGALDTDYIAREMDRLLPAPDARILALAGLAELARRQRAAAERARRTQDPFSPWQETAGWRLNRPHLSLITFEMGGERLPVAVSLAPEGYAFEIGGRKLLASGHLDEDGRLTAALDGVPETARVAFDGKEILLDLPRAAHHLKLYDPLSARGGAQVGARRITAPIPGRLVEVRAAAGAEVARGEVLVLLEAMKMEHGLAAPMDARVTAVHAAAGSLVEEGALLVDLEPLEGGG